MIFKNITNKSKYARSINTKGRHVFFLFNTSCELKLDIVAEGAEVYLFGLFIGENRNEYSVSTVQHHRVKNSKSSLFINGIFFDHSRFSHKGLIRIEKEAKRSAALQKTRGLILSADAMVDSRPYLEIMTKDAKCSHSVALGKIDSQALLYAQTRAIEKKLAEKLFIRGFITEFFQNMRCLGCSRQVDNIQSRYILDLKHLC